MPGSRFGKLKSPAPVVLVVVVMPVAVFVAATVAPEITAPVLSTTVPEICPLPDSCANAPMGAIMAMTRTASHPHLELRRSPCFRLAHVPLLYNCPSTAILLIQA